MRSTTTVIELLNKIANGEEAPKKIRYDNTIFNLIINDFGTIYYKNEYGEDLFNSYNIYKTLNEEVEIIKEDKKIEKIGEIADIDGDIAYSWSRTEAKLKTKINEIIDKINKMED